MAISPDRRTLYVGHRTQPAISSFRIDQSTGGLTLLGTVSQEHAPTFLAPDRTGKHLLCAYYQGGGTAVHAIGADGAVGAPSLSWLATATGAHAIATDRSNRFAFVPHIARLNDNVLEPPKENPGPNVIMQFRFDAQTGRADPQFAAPGGANGTPRAAPLLLSSDLRILPIFPMSRAAVLPAIAWTPRPAALSAMQTVTTLPNGYTARNTCSQIHLTPSGRFLYVGNRGHNSIAGFAVDGTGRLTAIGQASTEPVPSAFCLDPAGHFVFAAGSASGRLASYRINGETGALTPLTTYAAGQRPQAVLATSLGA